MESDEEKEDLRVFEKDASFHAGYNELWKVLWVIVMAVCGWNAIGIVAETIRDWWHYQTPEKQPGNAAWFLGLFLANIAYGMSAAEEKRATDYQSLKYEREAFLRRRKIARDSLDALGMKAKPFERYGCLKLVGYIIGGLVLLGLYLSKRG